MGREGSMEAVKKNKLKSGDHAELLDVTLKEIFNNYYISFEDELYDDPTLTFDEDEENFTI